MEDLDSEAIQTTPTQYKPTLMKRYIDALKNSPTI